MAVSAAGGTFDGSKVDSCKGLQANPLGTRWAEASSNHDAYPDVLRRIETACAGAATITELVPRLVTCKAFSEELAGQAPAAFRSFGPLVRDLLTFRQLLADAGVAFDMGVKLSGGVSQQLEDGRWEYRAFGCESDPKLREAPTEVRFVTIEDESDPSPRANPEELKRCLSAGTVFLNDVPACWPCAAVLCAEVTAALRLPSGCNVYVTAPGRRSNPAHSDHHDVIILQTQGSKRWCVYWPPEHAQRRDPFSRGKGGDLIGESELNLALDVTLCAGDLLYVPAGFPHATDTLDASACSSKTSVHITLHWSAHAWYLDFLNLRSALLIRAGEEEMLDEGSVPYAALWEEPGLYDILWHRPSASWTDLWPELVCRLERSQPGRWDRNSLRPIAEELLKHVHAYRERLVELSLQISHVEMVGFGSSEGAMAAAEQKSSRIFEMGELKEALLQWVNQTPDDLALSPDSFQPRMQ